MLELLFWFILGTFILCVLIHFWEEWSNKKWKIAQFRRGKELEAERELAFKLAHEKRASELRERFTVFEVIEPMRVKFDGWRFEYNSTRMLFRFETEHNHHKVSAKFWGKTCEDGCCIKFPTELYFDSDSGSGSERPIARMWVDGEEISFHLAQKWIREKYEILKETNRVLGVGKDALYKARQVAMKAYGEIRRQEEAIKQADLDKMNREIQVRNEQYRQVFGGE